MSKIIGLFGREDSRVKKKVHVKRSGGIQGKELVEREETRNLCVYGERGEVR